MKALLTSALLLAASLLATPASHAQLASVSVALPQYVLDSSQTDAGGETESGKTVYGVVQGANGVLPGATVWVHGSKTVAVANSEGVFELSVPAGTTEVEVTCSYAGLQEEVITIPVDDASNTLYLLRAQTPQGKHFVSDLTLKNRYDLLVKKVRNSTK